jgi:hypothetical protein
MKINRDVTRLTVFLLHHYLATSSSTCGFSYASLGHSSICFSFSTTPRWLIMTRFRQIVLKASYTHPALRGKMSSVVDSGCLSVMAWDHRMGSLCVLYVR